jgi:nanoRNase/pAp phosphatase (c-di-AMP/oligoRNAs hydrolase)
MLGHGGGGHHAAGTCQGPNDLAEAIKARLIEQITTPVTGLAAVERAPG